MIFLSDTVRQTINNLKRDRTLWKWRTWKSAASFLFGKHGMIRSSYRVWREYFRQDFHPDRQHSELSRRWLQQNNTAYSIVGTWQRIALPLA